MLAEHVVRGPARLYGLVIADPPAHSSARPTDRRNLMSKARFGSAAGAALLVLVAGCSGSGGSSGSSTPAGTVAQEFQAQHKGGTLHLMAKAAAGSFDPQVNYT